MAAFRKAVELGAGFIETDLQLSRDARLVALHDDSLERTTNGRGPVSSMTLQQLRRLDAGSWFRTSDQEADPPFAGERIPTVEEILAFGREQGWPAWTWACLGSACRAWSKCNKACLNWPC